MGNDASVGLGTGPATWKVSLSGRAPHFHVKNGDTKRQVLMVFKFAPTKEAGHDDS
jgi:hypothetical protein